MLVDHLHLKIHDRCQAFHRSPKPFAMRSQLIRMNLESQSSRQYYGHPLNISHVTLESFAMLFSRYRNVLYFVANRILHNHEKAEEAVQECYLFASRNVPQWNDEGSFRSWLVRVLIDEALIILHKKSSRSTTFAATSLARAAAANNTIRAAEGAYREGASR